MKPIRVLIADDQALVRSGIRALLEGIDDVQVVAEAGDGVEALRLIAEHVPDIVVLDISMPGLNGFDVLSQVGKKFPEVRTIVLTVHEHEAYAMRALSLGAMGYLTKTGASAELERAIQAVMGKEKYVSADLSRKIFLEHAVDSAQGFSPQLTPRQMQVLKMIAEGQSTKDIALNLDISIKTIESHRTQLMERLNIHDVAGLVRYAIGIGIIEIDD